MTSIAQLLEDIAAMMRLCPDILVHLHSDPAAILAYLDAATSEKNYLSRAIYSQPNGTVLIAWQTSAIVEGEMEGFGHQIDIFVRAARQQSPLPLLNAIIDATPTGNTERWRYLCVNADVLPMEIQEIARVTDEEGIDYYVIRTLFKEKGDFNGLSS